MTDDKLDKLLKEFLVHQDQSTIREYIQTLNTVKTNEKVSSASTDESDSVEQGTVSSTVEEGERRSTL